MVEWQWLGVALVAGFTWGVVYATLKIRAIVRGWRDG